MKEKYNFVFCKYAHGKKSHDFERCYNCEKVCPSVSNILHGKILKIPIIKQIYNICNKINFNIQLRRCDKDYISEYETTTMKFIWGIKSYDDLSPSSVNLQTMNDIDLIYLKDENKYILGIETIYEFTNGEEGKQKYLTGCLDSFTKFMEENNYNTDIKPNWYDVFSMNINGRFDSIEDCYAMFKLLVNGYYNEINNTERTQN